MSTLCLASTWTRGRSGWNSLTPYLPLLTTPQSSTRTSRTGAKVIRGRVLDGVAPHMTGAGPRGFNVAEGPDATQDEIVKALQESGAQILLNFLPVGSQQATEFYMECALAAGVGVVNCMPIFIASDPRWEARFRERRLPIIGDDIKAQVGAT